MVLLIYKGSFFSEACAKNAQATIIAIINHPESTELLAFKILTLWKNMNWAKYEMIA